MSLLGFFSFLSSCVAVSWINELDAFDRTGVPQVIIAMWVDLYDYAARAEWLGVGIWGNRQVAPFWTGEEIGESVLKIISNTTGTSYRERARAFATSPTQPAGQVVAAGEIVKAVKSGGSTGVVKQKPDTYQTHEL